MDLLIRLSIIDNDFRRTFVFDVHTTTFAGAARDEVHAVCCLKMFVRPLRRRNRCVRNEIAVHETQLRIAFQMRLDAFKMESRVLKRVGNIQNNRFQSVNEIVQRVDLLPRRFRESTRKNDRRAFAT